VVCRAHRTPHGTRHRKPSAKSKDQIMTTTMNLDDIYPSKYMKSADISGELTVTIDRIEIVDIGKNDRKPVIYFRGLPKGLVTNITNARTAAKLLGTKDMLQWIGRNVTLFVANVDFKGETVPAIRMKAARKVVKQVTPPIATDLDDAIPDFDGPPDPPPADDEGNPL
jgi:hypothetical protein